MNLPTDIIAIGGGKGGIGKSVVSANLAVGLALTGQEVILMDTDFGASNLHALLGISHPPYGFQDFFTEDAANNPSALLMDTGLPNLKFVSGAGDNPGSANIAPERIETITSFIHKLEADTLLLDMGPGMNFNVIDFFNLSDSSLVLTTPEMTSIMNTFSFIRASLFRKLRDSFDGFPELQELVDHSNPIQDDTENYTTALLRDTLKTDYPDQAHILESSLRTFKPRLIVNRVRTKRDLLVGDNLINLVKKFLEVDMDYLGYIVESDKVQESVEYMIPFIIKDPQSKPSVNLQQIIGTLTNMDVQLVKKQGKIFVSNQVRLASGWET